MRSLASSNRPIMTTIALLSAEQWVAAGNIAAAKQAFAQVAADARTRLPTPAGAGGGGNRPG